jgi:hypothetical protein
MSAKKIDANKLCPRKDFELDGREHTIKMMGFGKWLEYDHDAKMEKAARVEDPKERMKQIMTEKINFIVESSPTLTFKELWELDAVTLTVFYEWAHGRSRDEDKDIEVDPKN